MESVVLWTAVPTTSLVPIARIRFPPPPVHVIFSGLVGDGVDVGCPTPVSCERSGVVPLVQVSLLGSPLQRILVCSNVFIVPDIGSRRMGKTLAVADELIWAAVHPPPGTGQAALLEAPENRHCSEGNSMSVITGVAPPKPKPLVVFVRFTMTMTGS